MVFIANPYSYKKSKPAYKYDIVQRSVRGWGLDFLGEEEVFCIRGHFEGNVFERHVHC